MKTLALLSLFSLCLVMPATADEITFTVEEVNEWLYQFKTLYKDKKAPEEDAISVIENLIKAYEYLDGKGDQENKDEKKTRKKIVDYLAKGLRARKRPQVTTECAKALGLLGDKGGVKPLVRWLETTVLKNKNPNPQFVEAGFTSLAAIGPTDTTSLDFILAISSTGRHPDIGVANQALGAIPQWRSIPAKMRKEMFKKIMLDLTGIYSRSRQSGGQSRTYKERYDRVKDNGLRALWRLGGEEQRFANPNEVTPWWNQNKKKKWEDYVGPAFRKKAEKADKADKAEKKPPSVAGKAG